MFEFLPLSYTFNSRIITLSERISWFVIFPFFLFLLQFSVTESIFVFFVSFIAIMSIYEIGYLFNDFITTKNELNPTLRSGGYDSNYYKYFKYHIFSRLIIGFSLSFLFVFLGYGLHLFFFQLLILVSYYFHNTLRSRLNIITYFILVCLRYLGVVFYLSDPFIFFVIILCFPLCRTIEHSCKRKYNLSFIQNLVGIPDLFRVKYYFAIVLCLIVACLIFDSSYVYIFAGIYFLIYRSLSYFLRNKFKRNIHPSY